MGRYVATWRDQCLALPSLSTAARKCVPCDLGLAGRDRETGIAGRQAQAGLVANTGGYEMSNRRNSMLNCPRPWVRLRSVVV